MPLNRRICRLGCDWRWIIRERLRARRRNSRLPRLIKGYSDTHARGLSKFDKVIGAVGVIEKQPDAADWLRRLREAALQDEEGEALDGAIQTVRTM